MCRCEQAFRPTIVTTLAIVTAAAGLDWSGVEYAVDANTRPDVTGLSLRGGGG